ncbi:MAG: GAF domain-containing protein [Xanthobacteraceae bacterium]
MDIAHLTRELHEARQRQTATSEVLRLISSPREDLKSFFEALLENATRICEAELGLMYSYDGKLFHNAAMRNAPEALVEFHRQRGPFEPPPGTPLDRLLKTKDVVSSADDSMLQAPSAPTRFAGGRSHLAVPMFKGERVVGAVVIYRQEVRPFTGEQIELVRDFAAQAVIAIENARLLNELRESLEQQTATSEVLKIIAGSPGELDAVFTAMLENARHICDAKFGILMLRETDGFRTVAIDGAPAAYTEAMRENPHIPPRSGSGLVALVETKKPVQIADVQSDPGYVGNRLTKLAGARTLLIVPMLKDDAVVGAINVYREEVRSFTEQQIALLQNFAAQAVIAIENARLLNELRESLEQQTATANVLRIISSSPGELQPVFQAILENVTRICESNFGVLNLYESGGMRMGAMHNVPSAFADWLLAQGTYQPIPNSPPDRVIRTRKVVHVLDNAAEAVPGRAATLGGARTTLTVPMLKNEALIGTITIFRQEVRPFADEQIVLLANFANQAVIAVENARLLNELRESLQQQTAAAEVLKVITSSPGDLTPVFEALLTNAVTLCGAKFGNLFLCNGDQFTMVAMHGAPAAATEWWRNNRTIRPGPHTGLARLLETKQVNQTEDLRAGAAYAEREPLRVATVELAGARTLVDIPLLKDDVLIGAIVIYRQEVRLFLDKEIELLKNFAAQAVIAIENARLLNELRQRTTDLSESLEQQTATADVLRVINSSPGDLDPVFTTILDKALDLCEAAFGFVTIYDGKRFERGVQRGVPEALAAYFGKGMDQPRPGDAHWRLLAGEELIHNLDQKDEEAYRLGNPLRRAVVDLGGARTALVVALRKDNVLLGALTVYRKEVRPFSEKQVGILQSFAAQAVIAIENARLLKELRERTAQLEGRSEEIAKLNAQLEARVADQVGEIERMGRLRRFLPPQVADLIVASGAENQLESHRREITALFCDLRGFTGFSESSDPEDVMTLLRQYHEAIGTIIIKYSGTLERYAGDGVMVVFNDPVPVDNPALQAVRMALEMRAALSALIEKWRRLGHELGFGIGIAHGYATLGTIGFEGRFDYAAIGTVSNVASRLCDEAKPGQILISPRVLMAVEDAVAVESVGDFALKGISRPLAAYNVVGTK